LEVVTTTSDFTYWYTKYNDYVQRIARRMNCRDTEGATQEVWAAFWERRAHLSYDPSRSKETTFLWNIAAPRMLGWREKELRVLCRSISQNTPEDNRTHPTTNMVKDIDVFPMMVNSILRSLAELPQRGSRDLVQVFILIAHGFRQCEIADMLGCSKSTVTAAVRDLQQVPAVVELYR
jgi:DNA-directed RNA polymerase specialized sigma24 family protein